MPQESPLPIRAFNRIVGPTSALLRSLGVPVLSLDPESLLRRASRHTQLRDFGDAAFREPLDVYLRSLDTEARLTALGRQIAGSDCLRLLENRLHLVDTWKRHPEIEAAPVRQPLFILGLPRTGTSILHELFGQDPANRVPSSWEAMRPWPPPERATYRTDPRIAEVDKHLAGVDRLVPGFKQMHPMAAELPQECVTLMAHDFATMIFHTQHRVPSYQAWLERADMRPIYRGHRRQLQYFQWRCPGERWVLKSPAHLWHLDAMLDEYPDARIVQTHRDPLRVAASLASLVTLLRGLASDDVDRGEVGADWAPRLARGLEHAMQVREERKLGDDRVLDIQFRDFMADELGAVRRIYDHFEMELSREAEERMRAFLAANPRDKHGSHRYRVADYGLDPARERKRFAPYQSRFDIPEESDV